MSSGDGRALGVSSIRSPTENPGLLKMKERRSWMVSVELTRAAITFLNCSG